MKYLVVDPFSGIWPHSRASAQVAQALLGSGHQVTLFGCGQALEYHCHVNESYNRKFSTSQVNKDCKTCSFSLAAVSKSLSRYSKFRSINAKSLVSRPLLDNEYEKFMRSPNRVNYRTSDGHVPVGKLAMYETSLKFKKNSLELEEGIEDEFHQATTKNAITMALAATELMNRETFDALIVYSPQYSSPGAVAWIAEQKGSKVFFVEGSSSAIERASHLRLWDWRLFGLDNPRLYDFDPRKTIHQSEMSRVDLHLKSIEKAKHYSVYSTRATVFHDPLRELGVPAKSKVALLTMSSSDEVLAAMAIEKFPLRRTSSDVFFDQLDWLKETINWFSKNQEFYLVVRPHPRDFSTKREPATAKHSVSLAEILSDLPDNVLVDPPDSGIPLWSYFPKIKLLITGWSSTALEALVHGVQVVAYDEKLCSFPDSLVLTGNSREHYFRNVGSGLEVEWDKEELKEMARRWLYHTLFSSTIALRPPLLNKLGSRFPSLNRLMNLLDRLSPRMMRRLDINLFSKGEISKLSTQLELQIGRGV
jgi:hypothetical protein